ncbi:hypothetical protein HHL22_00065 [Hymenobacter sp. RP-2-7]|uniref:8-amino-7-oxononanoate synthase n=1 Tax=Hymenobacter polaris TaxID=2682546 RepID=A0A7Y0AA53_9BACT|nr:hypothetical protein [Hymenobacter polaris]NML63594.1 hypothetical protein [Hymenobacter polaris]
MNRELSIDATQVALGDDSTLTLTLSSEPRKKPLATELGTQGLIKLTVDHLADNRPVEAHYFPYAVDGSGLQLRGEVVITAAKPGGSTSKNTPPPKLFYSKLEPVTKPQPLNTGQSADLTWSVRVWDQPGTFVIGGELFIGDPATLERDLATDAALPNALDFGPVKLRVQQQDPTGPVQVTMKEADREESNDQALWGLIRRRTISFSQYQGFINRVLCTQDGSEGQRARAYAQGRPLAFSRSASYSMLKYATEFFLMQEAGLAMGDALDTGAGSGNLNSLPPSHAQPDLDEQRRLGGAPFSLSALRDNYLEQLENEEGKVLPYFKIIREKLAEVPLKNPQDLIGGDDVCYGILKSKLQAPPLMELIWSYWHEEGGLVQTLNAISLRFQNVRRPGYGPDPLAGLNLDPLRPMANLMWGYIEDERNRLTLNRRNLEYQYEYGIGLIGRGVQPIAVAENRTFFLRGFHSLLRACTEFYQQANFTTVIPDGFPILNCLREVHMTLAEGAHNQYGDLPWTARAEMLTQQWLLARPEVREFLGGRVMVPYTEPWMDRVDTMKTLQGWNPTNITHFRDLGAFGEQLLLSIRYGAWNSPTIGAVNAANWAYYWRQEIQRYIHAYKAVTGVDLATDLGDVRQQAPDNEERYLQPAQLIERQNALQQSQLRRSRQLSAGLGPLRRPAFGPLPRRRAFNGDLLD